MSGSLGRAGSGCEGIGVPGQEQLGGSAPAAQPPAPPAPRPAEQVGHAEQVREADPPALTAHRPEARHHLLRGGLGGHLQLRRPAHRADGDAHHHHQAETLPNAVEGQDLRQHAVRGQPQRHAAGRLRGECVPGPLPPGRTPPGDPLATLPPPCFAGRFRGTPDLQEKGLRHRLLLWGEVWGPPVP